MRNFDLVSTKVGKNLWSVYEITIYSWVMFWVVCSIVLAYEIYFCPISKKKCVAFVVCALGAASTHYYGDAG